mgnify:CR=1 FL=1
MKQSKPRMLKLTANVSLSDTRTVLLSAHSIEQVCDSPGSGCLVVMDSGVRHIISESIDEVELMLVECGVKTVAKAR